MNVAVTRAPPIHKFDAEFEGGLRRLHKLGFVEPEEVVEILHLRQRRFANAAAADLFGFDEADAEARGVELGGTGRGAPPPRGPAADAHDFEFRPEERRLGKECVRLCRSRW